MKNLFFLVLLCLLFLTNCKQEEAMKPQETYVLVHGAWLGGWSWDKVKPLLEAKGHKVVVIDLPGSGDDNTPINGRTLQAYTDKVVQTINAQTQPVILVGHSMGGIVISQANEVVATKIKKLVYVSAYLLKKGESLYAKSLEPEHASSKIGANWVQTSQDVASINPAGVKEVFCADCTETDANTLKTKMKEQAIAPLGTPLTVNADVNMYKEKRFYIETLNDNAVPNAVQKKMYLAMPCQKILSLSTSHSSFMAVPQQFVDILVSIN